MTDVSTVTVTRRDPDGDEDLVFVRGYRALRMALNDWKTFSSDTHGFLVLSPQDKTRSYKQYPFELDPPEHTSFRAAVEPFFKRPLDPAYAARLQPHITAAVTQLLEAPQLDVTEEFSLPLQSRALTVLLDMPEEEADVWVKWGINVFGAQKSGDKPDLDRADALVAYVAEKTDAADNLPPGSLFAVLARATVDGRPLTRDERMGFAHIAFSGGRDTVIAMITGIVALFARHPEAKEAIRTEPKLAQSATEELIRLISPLRVLTRVCPHGGTVDGVEVAPGQRIALCYGRGSHDPATFEDPEAFKIDRKPNPHLAFGAGPHACLGNAHARLISRQLMVELANRVESIEVIDAVPEPEKAPQDVDGLRFQRLVVRAV